jgi:hypothetical protein
MCRWFTLFIEQRQPDNALTLYDCCKWDNSTGYSHDRSDPIDLNNVQVMISAILLLAIGLNFLLATRGAVTSAAGWSEFRMCSIEHVQ